VNNTRIGIFAILALSGSIAFGQLSVTTNVTPASLVQDILVGSCVSVSNITYNGSATPAASSIERGSFTAIGTNLGITNGVILATGNAGNAGGASTNFESSSTGTGSDADLATLSGVTIADVSILEFDFVPNGDSISFRFVFASEEYPEYVCGTVNDAFGFFLSGPGIAGPFANNAINIAVVPGTSVPITINTVNAGVSGTNGTASNCTLADPNWQSNNIYYVDNTTGADVVYDAFTTVLTARASVQCAQTYHIKLAIGDGGDSVFDSAVFLEGGSFSSVPFIPSLSAGPSIVGNTIYESCLPLSIDFLRTSCDLTVTETVNISYAGSAMNGTDIAPALPTQIVFAPGDSIISFPFNAPVDPDGIEDLILTLQTIDCNGDSASNVFTFQLDELPPLQLNGANANIACGDSTLFTPQVSGGFGQYTYAWSMGEITPTLMVSPISNTTIQLTVTDLCAATISNTYQVNLTPAPPLNMSILGESDLVEGCEIGTVNIIRPPGSQGALTVQIAGTGTATNNNDYTLPSIWVIPDGVLNNQMTVPVNDDALVEGNETIVITGSYTNACAQTVSASVTFMILDVDPLVVITNDIQAECSGDSAIIAASASGGSGPYTYAWSNNDVGPSIYVPLLIDGTYTVIVTDVCGRIGSEAALVTIDCLVIIPNVFSPNNDGYNDRWEIEGLGSRNTVKVFNRWGNVVLDAKNYRNNWAASDVPDGTYFYEVLMDNKPDPYTGYLTILRKY